LTVTNATAVDPGATYSYNPVVDTVNFPTSWFGGCRVDAGTHNIIAFVQMRIVGKSPIANYGAYAAIPANLTKTKAFVPLIAKALGNGFATVVNIANLSSSTNYVDLTYVPSALECSVAVCDRDLNGVVNANDAIVIQNVEIKGNASVQRSHRFGTADVPERWVGSLKIESDSASNLPIGAIVQLTNLNTLPGDPFMVHEAFSQ
jgi:hypothetical protein